MTSISFLTKICFIGISVAGAPAEPGPDTDVVDTDPAPPSGQGSSNWSPPSNGYQGPPSNHLKPWPPVNSYSGPVGFSAPSWRQPQPRSSWPSQPAYSTKPYPMVQADPSVMAVPSDDSSSYPAPQPYSPYNSGYNPGYGNSGYNPGYGNGNSGYNPGYGNGNSGYNPGNGCGLSGCSPLYPSFGNGNSGYNPGSGCGSGMSSGCAPLYNTNSGYNPGSDSTDVVVPDNNGNSGYNPGYDTGNSGYNPGTSSGCGTGSSGCSSPLYPYNSGNTNSGYNPGTSNSGFNPGTSNSGYNPGNSFTPLPGRNCYDVCRNRCSGFGWGGNFYGGCRPVCKPRCNITPVCVGNQWQQGPRNSYSCGGSGWGFNAGSNYNPSLSIPAQNGYAGVNTLPAKTGGCGLVGGGCSDAALPPVTATAGPAPVGQWADEDEDSANPAVE